MAHDYVGEGASRCWRGYASGLPSLLTSHPPLAEDLLAESGFATRAMRQAPFTAWRRGQAGCRPKLMFPGSNTNDRDTRHISRVKFLLPDSACEGLEGLVMRAWQLRHAPQEAPQGRSQPYPTTVLVA